MFSPRKASTSDTQTDSPESSRWPTRSSRFPGETRTRARNTLKVLGVNPIPREREALVLNLFLILSAGAVIVTLSPALSSPLGPIDDHEYLKYRFFNPSGDLLLGARQGLDRAWEEFTKEGRVRPIYQIGRTLTTSLIADNAFIRYAFRMAIATGVVTALTATTIKRDSASHLPLSQRLLLGITSTTLSLTVLPWSDVVGRLGPPDSLGILGLFLAFSALALALRSPNRTPHHALTALFFCGLIVAAGSRESYAIHTAVITASLLLFFRSQLNLGVRTLAALTFFCIYPLTSIIALRLRSGTDFYGKDRTLLSSFEAFYDFMSSDLFTRNAPVIALWWVLSGQRQRRQIAYLSIVAFLMMAMDFLQYSSALSVYGRYRFVSDFVFLVALLGACEASFRLINRFRSPPARKWAGRLLAPAATAIFILFWIPQLQDARSEFEYASRLNRGYALTVSNILSEVENSSNDAVLVLTDPLSEAYHARDLQERSLGLFWSVRYSLPPSTTVLKSDASSQPSTIGASFCIFVGIAPTPELSETWSCQNFTQVF